MKFKKGDAIRSPNGAVQAVASGTTLCTNWTHSVTINYLGFFAFRSNVWKSWCWTYYDLYNATLTGPFSASKWVDTGNGWQVTSNDWVINGWRVSGVSHQSMTNSYMKKCTALDCIYRSQTNSFCGKNYGNYSYNNDCS